MGTIVIPVWVAIIGAVLALWALLDRLLVPSVRWVIRSRANKVLDEVGQRLRLQIRPFQQTSRRTLIDRLVFDEKVQQAATTFAQANKVPREVAHQIVERYAREIVPAFNAYFYFRVGAWLSRKVSRLLYRVRIGYSDEAGLSAVPPSATVVFVMNHRSNMDYILAAHLAAEQAALSYAVGEWARIWPLQQMIRAMGAYFVRRGSGNELYRRVLERYIAMATESGVTQAVYPEGGLTRDGRLREPKFGVLEYMLRGFSLDGDRDLVFVPLGFELRPRAGGSNAAIGGQFQRKKARCDDGFLEHIEIHFQPTLARTSQQVVPLRLCVRELRYTDFNEELLHATRHRLSQTRQRRSDCRSQCPGTAPDGPGRASDSCVAGAAGCARAARSKRRGYAQ